jgi:hypothetical protein
MIKLFEQCPACGGPLVVTECRCANCHLQLRGDFRVGSFSTLSEDQLTFVHVFLRARGNLSEVEKVLGVSYPTIRNKLDEINKTLDRVEVPAAPTQDQNEGAPGTGANPAEDKRRAILQQVAQGKLSASEAVQQLRDLQGGE